MVDAIAERGAAPAARGRRRPPATRTHGAEHLQPLRAECTPVPPSCRNQNSIQVAPGLARRRRTSLRIRALRPLRQPPAHRDSELQNVRPPPPHCTPNLKSRHQSHCSNAANPLGPWSDPSEPAAAPPDASPKSEPPRRRPSPTAFPNGHTTLAAHPATARRVPPSACAPLPPTTENMRRPSPAYH